MTIIVSPLSCFLAFILCSVLWFTKITGLFTQHEVRGAIHGWSDLISIWGNTGEQVIEMPSSHDRSWLPRDRPHSGEGLLDSAQSRPEAPAGLGREISLMPPKEFNLESGKRMSENALCYSLLIKLLFLKNMNSFFFWLNSACIHWERNVTRCRGYYCALVIFKSLLIRVEFNFGIKKHCRWFYWIFMSMSQMSVFQMPFA